MIHFQTVAITSLWYADCKVPDIQSVKISPSNVLQYFICIFSTNQFDRHISLYFFPKESSDTHSRRSGIGQKLVHSEIVTPSQGIEPTALLRQTSSLSTKLTSLKIGKR